MKKKRKVYLDTSVISHLDAPDVPEKMADTWRLWDLIEQGTEFEVVTSVVTELEIRRCGEPKRTQMAQWLAMIECEIHHETPEVLDLTNEYVQGGILSAKHIEDVLHIAHAVVAGCGCIASWNFKHLVNVKTIDRVNAVNIVGGYAPVQIVSPTMLIEGGNDE